MELELQETLQVQLLLKEIVEVILITLVETTQLVVVVELVVLVQMVALVVEVDL